ncbi:MAG: hypothetical protein IT472_02565 [Thermomonas sp.]|uniref:hypothetical protein n=1 Tax=Thermomonas sp. TaxID=1971895 RepID=UPI0026105DC1|nr:hypothetical protein [Thermomonas sp.]MCC7096051.1 hypothetical protein [Thermomonas sp.]
MRQVFRSQRLENVEVAADLLRKQGIEVKIANGRSWRGYRRGNFSYDLRKARDPETLPTLWIVNADDQPRARQILRELGLLESTRESDANALPNDRFSFTPGSGANSTARKRWRIGLLAMIGVVIALIVFLPRHKGAPPVAPAPRPAAAPAVIPEAITETSVFRLDVPKALAAKLISTAASQHRAQVVCASIDGKDPATEVFTMVTNGGLSVRPASSCNDPQALRIAVERYMTDGSGSGEVQLRIGDTASTTVSVQRDGRDWSVLDAR